MVDAVDVAQIPHRVLGERVQRREESHETRLHREPREALLQERSIGGSYPAHAQVPAVSKAQGAFERSTEAKTGR